MDIRRHMLPQPVQRPRQRSLLPRLDLLSTVSGGGYIGATFGRLVQALGIHEAQRMLAARNSPLLDWLRRNGRYLTPAGGRDIGLAAVTYLRAFVAIKRQEWDKFNAIVSATDHDWYLDSV